ncbi:hypothetical protein AVEN_40013-1 [Araneus ventricosus]|uniref:Uncharacterized protein n=1 Tax=Araneus ventricosus TaxID=182803 RepID=A0A4Y2G1Z5_ARAVE|nr:hypothetical protein AVEN_40013-1 [Araneus ventricosus]
MKEVLEISVSSMQHIPVVRLRGETRKHQGLATPWQGTRLDQSGTNSLWLSLLAAHRRITTEIAIELSISKGTVHHINPQKDWLWKVCAQLPASVRESEDGENGFATQESKLKPSTSTP